MAALMASSASTEQWIFTGGRLSSSAMALFFTSSAFSIDIPFTHSVTRDDEANMVFAGLLVPHIPTQFLDTGSQKYLQISVAPPSGTPSAVVLKAAQAVEERLRSYPEVNLIETTVPSGSDTGLSALAAAFNSSAAVLEFDGSTTVYPVVQVALTRFPVDFPDVTTMTATATGSGHGQSEILAGVPDFGMSSSSCATSNGGANGQPAAIYEAISNIILFAILWSVRNRVKPGILFFVYIFGVNHFAIE